MLKLKKNGLNLGLESILKVFQCLAHSLTQGNIFCPSSIFLSEYSKFATPFLTLLSIDDNRLFCPEELKRFSSDDRAMKTGLIIDSPEQLSEPLFLFSLDIRTGDRFSLVYY